MTLEQIKAMTDDELRIKVAELMGWVSVPHRTRPLTGKEFSVDTQGTAWTELPYEMPNWPGDLNACAEMEDTLDDSQKDSFEYLLGIVIGPGRERWRWHLLHATARQRCEAFIATKEREV